MYKKISRHLNVSIISKELDLTSSHTINTATRLKKLNLIRELDESIIRGKELVLTRRGFQVAEYLINLNDVGVLSFQNENE